MTVNQKAREFAFEKWTVAPLVVDAREAKAIWDLLQYYPTLFSDDTKGMQDNFLYLLTSPDCFWFGVKDGRVLIGIVYLSFAPGNGTADVHIIFLDRKPSEKKYLCKLLAKHFFDWFPDLHRLQAEVPKLYRQTWRLAQNIGLRWEGTRRQAVVIGSRRWDVFTFGLLREETDGLLDR